MSKRVTRARVFLSGAVTGAIELQGLPVSKGARAAIENAGGKVH